MRYRLGCLISRYRPPGPYLQQTLMIKMLPNSQVVLSGKKRLTVSERPRTFPVLPVKSEARRSYTHKKKMQVLSCWTTASIPKLSEDPAILCTPTVYEVLIYFDGIPISCIWDWREIEKALTNSNATHRRRVLMPAGRFIAQNWKMNSTTSSFKAVGRSNCKKRLISQCK